MPARVSVPWVLALALALLTPRSGHADGPIGPNGSRIRTSEYRVDLTQTPVVAGSRVVGLGGSYVAIAEGTDGNLQNAAAPAVRVPWSIDKFDYDLGAGLSFPTSLEKNDFFNTGRNTDTGQAREDGAVFINLAANFQYRKWGIGASIDLQPYGLQQPASQGDIQRLDALITTARLQVARMFIDNQLVVGLGARLITLNVSQPGGQPSQLFTTQAAGLEAGALWRPNDQPYRLGLNLRSQVLTNPDLDNSVPANALGDFVIGDPTAANAVFLPSQAAVPWDIHVGAAVQFGKRPLNPRWVDPQEERERIAKAYKARRVARDRRRAQMLSDLQQSGRATPENVAAILSEFEKEAAVDEAEEERLKEAYRDRLKVGYLEMARFYVLVTASLVIIGDVQDAVGLESFLRQEVDRSGEDIDFSPRLGIETEAIPHWVKLRVGGYYEPTRFDNGLASDRIHGTVGFDAKLFPWTVFGIFEDPNWWRAGAVVDVADRYFSWGLSIGVWH